MQEAKDSSAIENIITTHDELFRIDIIKGEIINQSTKEVENYRAALQESYQQTKSSGLIRVNDILRIQEVIEPKKSGIRKIPGTVTGNATTKEVIYTPPQHPDEINELLTNLVKYINDDQLSEIDPLIKMAIIHHQFESIHPFYDGNGRAGRIINILYLVKNGLLDLPILYLSRYIVRTKSEYYRLLQIVRDENDWESWILYIIKGIEETAKETIEFINQTNILVLKTKQRMRTELPKIYSQELLNNLFFHPYTKVQFVVDQVGVSRLTATKYLNQLAEQGFVNKHKMGRTNYYVNEPLVRLIIQQEEY
jgi:Fic family protein